MTIARVVTNLSLDREFDYRIPGVLHGQVRVGSRVRVPFGRGSAERVGYVVGLADRSAYGQLKEITAVEADTAQIPENLVRLAQWIADYYCCTREQAVRSVLPAVVRHGKIAQKKRRIVTVNPEADLADAAETLERRAPKQAALLHAIVRLQRCEIHQLLHEADAKLDAVKRLAEKNLVTLSEEVQGRDPFADEEILRTSHLVLTRAQRQALEVINASQDRGGNDIVLLHGVTGSGKTEVYLQAIDRCLSLGREAIVLVPEISLTPQTVERFRGRFGDTVCVLHSGLSDGERYDEWIRIREGRAKIAVGARSALFAPFQRVGLIVVDEEHESTYKQEEAPRYNARDVAVVRGKMETATVVLGSATPAMESFRNVREGKYLLAHLPKRVDNQRMPYMELVDMTAEAATQGGPQIFSRRLHSLILDRLDKGEQTLLFLNRRGYATQMMCTECGFVATCEDCNHAFTYHKRDARLICHLCGNLQAAPDACPQCGDRDVKYPGLGTEKIERAAHGAFPHATIARMDSDTMTRRDSYRKVLNEFRSGRIHILIGTQMIAKGLHFPNVTLVGIVFADMSLHMPDFRAGERTFQLLTQVAGRAGRGEVPGHVVVQSYTPFNPALQYALHHDVEGFRDEELEIRELMGFPPATHMVLVHFSGENERSVAEFAAAFAEAVRDLLPEDAAVVEPSPSPIAKVRRKFRYQMAFRTTQVVRLSRLLRQGALARSPRDPVQVAVDIDPLSLL